MKQTSDATEAVAAEQPLAVRLSRLFHARPETVFAAWSSADHVKRWFSPETYTVSNATVEMRIGGPFDVCMRAPDGTEHWTRGTFVEVVPHTRLIIDMRVVDGGGDPLFRAYTEINFSETLGGTIMDIVQTYTFNDPAIAAPMVDGAPEGWRTTLDKLAREVVRLQCGGEPGIRSVTHDTFRLERTYDAPVTRVWTALTDEAAKSRWFGGAPGRWELLERNMDVCVGGRERVKGRWEGGVVSTFDAIYHDVIPNERLVYTYEMHLDDKKISVSLATMELTALDRRTTLTVTEQGAFLDGYDDAGSREEGTDALLDAIGASLKY